MNKPEKPNVFDGKNNRQVSILVGKRLMWSEFSAYHDEEIAKREVEKAELVGLLKDIELYFLNRVGQTRQTEFHILELLSKWTG